MRHFVAGRRERLVLLFASCTATRSLTIYSRRELFLHTSAGCAALAALSPLPSGALVPIGAPAQLVPVLACARALDGASAAADGEKVGARALLALLRSPPFTDDSLPRTTMSSAGNSRRPIPLIANMLRRSVKRYEASLQYDAGSLSADDKRKCFPTPPEGADCIRALVRVDLDAKDMVRNDALGAARFRRSRPLALA